MPLISVTTNTALDTTQREKLLRTLSRRVAEQLGKPERYVMAAYLHNADMLFAGTSEPLAYVELKSIGLPASNTSALSNMLCLEIAEITQVDSSRIYIEFTDAARDMWGWNRGTFA